MTEDRAYVENMQKLKRILNLINFKINYPKLGGKEYLFIPSSQRELFYDLFDLEGVKVDINQSSFDKFNIYSQIDEKDKIHNWVYINDVKNINTIYFYPWLENIVKTFDPENDRIVNKTFISFRKLMKKN